MNETVLRAVELTTHAIIIFALLYLSYSKPDSFTGHAKKNFRGSILTATCAVINIIFALIKMLNEVEIGKIMINLIAAIAMIVLAICFESNILLSAKIMDSFINKVMRDE